MKKIEIKELKQIQLNILIEVHNFCIERGLRYSLCGGTLLGAVRHKGFIPWDDDIDIMMPRPDYNSFMKGFNGYKPHLICGAYENDKNYMFPHIKVYDKRTVLIEINQINPLGINIDVFPIDGFPESIKDTEKILKQFYIGRALLSYKISKGVLLSRKLRHYITKLLPLSIIQRNINNIIQKYDYETSRYIGIVCGRYLSKERFPRFVFSNFIELQFENFKCKAIEQYDIYLSQLYGNYMELPPYHERKSHHDITDVFWK